MIVADFRFIYLAAKITLFSRNHQENHKKSVSYQQITTKSTVNYKLLTVNYKLLFPGGPIPHKMAKGFDAPPTLERSGSEHRRAVTSSRP